MKRTITLLALSSALLFACKPTPRTAVGTPAKDTPEQTTEQNAAEQPAAETATAPDTQAAGLLKITSTRQDFNRLRPWEKKNPSTGHFSGVYLGNGRVLTVGRAARAATYVELSLLDQSRTVPARVVKYDDDLGLALLTVEHPEDASIFDKLTAHPVGQPLKLGDKAELHTITPNLTPMRVGVEVESVDQDAMLPRLEMRAEKPFNMEGDGLPILQDDHLVALVDMHDTREQSLTCINAEFINRFLDESTTSGNGVPVLGLRFEELNDPIFSKYLKLNPDQGGIYVSKVLPSGSAQAAGVREGDVITSIENLPLDKLGRAKHPIYGLMDALHLIRSLKPVGQQIKLGISRDGAEQEISVLLNRDALDKNLLGQEKPNVAPRYIVWGGLVFQPITTTYLNALPNLSLPLLLVKEHQEELQAEGRKELVGLTLVIPTPATLSYDALGFCLVEEVNGKRVHSFAEFAELLDTPTDNGITELTINQPPYRIYLDRQAAEATNDVIRRRAIPRLRHLGETEGK